MSIVAIPSEDLCAAAELLGAPVAASVRIGGGRNSRVYRVADMHGKHFALKLYFRNERDPRDRRATEFNGLQFLHRHRMRCIPEPLSSNARLGASLFGFIEGETVSAAEANEADIDRLTDFVLALRRLARLPGSASLPAASDAVFSLAKVVESIEGRLTRLEEVRGDGEVFRQFEDFLRDDLRPTFRTTVSWARRLRAEQGLDEAGELDPTARTLSPSDLGFHNALRKADGNLAFVDFEYFGWDDPAKLVSDFLLHPGMALTTELRGRFLANLFKEFSFDRAFDVRVRTAYALYALKWCTILLNEFVPESLQRRLFADPNLCPDEVRRAQLEKARAMLSLARKAPDAFPYEEWVSP